MVLIIFSHSKQAQQCLHQLAGKQSPQIAVNTECRNGKEYEAKAYQKAEHAVEEGESGFAQTV